MVNSTALMLFLWPQMLYQKQSTTVSIPFTHDFNTSLHGWEFETGYWDWTGDPTRSPDTTNIPSFYSYGNHVWTQGYVSGKVFPFMAFYLFKATSVTSSTSFTFRYWYSTTDSGEEKGLLIYIMDYASSDSFPPAAHITHSSDQWNDITISCTGSTCCSSSSASDCEVQIQIIGSVGDSNSDGIASIACVSTEGGCGPLPIPPTTTSKPTTKAPSTTVGTTSPPQPAPGGSPLTSTPNVLAMAASVLMLLIAQPLYR